MDFQKIETLDWLKDTREHIQRLLQGGRLPHAFLILSKEGLGAGLLADWIAAAVLCDNAAQRPCGSCPSCALLRSESHPDLHRIDREEDALQVKIDQVRGLIDALAYTSYRGGYKVGILNSAETLNASSANAFLKTLEEPPANTLLLMIATPNHRLPATIASRCHRLVLNTPTNELANAWLLRHGGLEQGRDVVLRLSHGAPLRALDMDPVAAAALAQEMAQSVTQLDAKQVDVSLVAERWLRSEFPRRLIWLENWITDRIRAAGSQGNTGIKTVDAVVLPGSLLKAKIRSLFDLLDDTRELKRLTGTSINLQLAVESVLIKHFVRE
jgi:DNA polymerase-3 subunit delta'